MLTVCGSASLDTIRTPKRTLENILGGAGTFSAVSASNFVETGLIGVVGEDFPERYRRMLSDRLDLQGLVVKPGRTFHYDGIYDRTLSSRSALKTELNVMEDYVPSVPEAYRKSRFVYLATGDPEHSIKLAGEFDDVRFSMCDTIDFWINSKRQSVISMIKTMDAVVINDEEAKLLTKEFNLIKCAKKMMEWGAEYVIIKKGEHGSLMFHEDVVFPAAGFSLEDVVDPTGAGDSFAGAMIGYLASRESTRLSDIRRAAVYGNVLGSFAVEGYGMDGLLRIGKKEISERIAAYERMVEF